MSQPQLATFVGSIKSSWEQQGLNIEWCRSARQRSAEAFTMLGVSREVLNQAEIEGRLRRMAREHKLKLHFEKEGQWRIQGDTAGATPINWHVSLSVRLAHANITIANYHAA